MSAAKFQMVGMNFKRCDLNVRHSMHADGWLFCGPMGHVGCEISDGGDEL